jgi:hypothetical protein
MVTRLAGRERSHTAVSAGITQSSIRLDTCSVSRESMPGHLRPILYSPHVPSHQIPFPITWHLLVTSTRVSIAILSPKPRSPAPPTLLPTP